MPTFQRRARKIPSWKDSDDDADAGWCASFDPSAMSEILEGLYLGGEWSSKRRERLLGAGVTHVLCAAPLPELFPGDFHYLRWPIADDGAADLLSALPRLHAFIDDALDGGGAVLVHCHAGASRSASVVISYVMRERVLGVPAFDAALRYVVARRPVVCPHFGFVQQLERYEKSLMI